MGTIDAESQALMDATEGSLWAGIAQARAGNFLADISKAIETHVVQRGFHVVREYTGHGVGRRMHEEPNVLNYVPAGVGRGPKLKSGHDVCARAHGWRRHVAHQGDVGWLAGRYG